MQIKDLTGQRFDRLYVEKLEYIDRRSFWRCVCDCGTTKILPQDQVKANRSCGCFQKEQTATANSTHKQSNTKLYYVWLNLKNRCLNKNNNRYKSYGGRGITVCKEWIDSFESFYSWSESEGYCEGLTIDRINNDLGYYPENCRWVSSSENSRNRSTNNIVEINGEYMPLIVAVERFAHPTITYKTVMTRIHKLKWSIVDALSRPKYKK